MRFGAKDVRQLLPTVVDAVARHGPAQDQHSMCGRLRLLAQLEQERPLRARGHYPSYDGIADG
ncbi:hypothetical protein [Streptomyces adelaidensis]|uniref:hypothetical protein n=1 Tax=Streptomyces adelaidensis TaxID=2796465 RepID=UPI0027DCA168|nr:hypothetical protein [Streptomyces adelaidensis]